jgi:hypothetical protein
MITVTVTVTVTVMVMVGTFKSYAVRFLQNYNNQEPSGYSWNLFRLHNLREACITQSYPLTIHTHAQSCIVSFNTLVKASVRRLLAHNCTVTR